MSSPVTLTADMPIQISIPLQQRKRAGELMVIVTEIPLTLFVDASERQCRENHSGQSLERIRERGGFGATEAVAVLSNLRFWNVESIKEEHAMRILYSMIAIHNRGMRIAEANAKAALA